MKAMILAAGKGSRMAEITKDEISKLLLNLDGKPIIQDQIEKLRDIGVREICMNLHFKPESLREFLGDGSKFGVKINYNYEPEILGTSGSLLAFKDILDETFFVIYGDIFHDMDLKKLYEFHTEKKAKATLVVHKSSHPEDSDIAEIDGEKIIALHHKPGTREFGDIGNAALYVVEPVIFNYLPREKSDFIKDIFPKMLEAGEKVCAYNTPEFIKDTGTPERLTQVQQYLKERKN
jgi:mannose-1-phosphate guanylyltransferase / phosphomannomutase